MSETHVNRLCQVCVNNCKQSDSARIVECPNFIKMPTDHEFRRMVDDLDAAETRARTIRTRARELIQDALTASNGDETVTDGGSAEPEEPETTG